MIYYRKGVLDYTTEGWEVIYDNPVSGDNRAWFEEERLAVGASGGVKMAQGRSIYFTTETTASGRMTAVLAEKPITKVTVRVPTGLAIEFSLDQEWSAEFHNGYTQAIADIRNLLPVIEKRDGEFAD